MKIGDKTFLNLQEAVAWLLENNALPYQSTANYVANTEIALSTLVNPSPAKVRVGSLIFFADSKVSTVIGVTSNSFIVSDQYNNLVDDIAYVTGVTIDASGHLITTLSDGQTIDAGIVKQVSSFSIDGSQHLVANYNDGTSTDLGAIFSGNITISGDLAVTGSIAQDNFNYLSSEQTIDSVWLNGLTVVSSYVRFGVINKVLYIVISAQLKNETGSDITTVAGRPLFNSSLPLAIANKIYRKDGTTCNVPALDSNGEICVLDLLLTRQSGAEQDRKSALIYSANAYQIAIWLSTVAFTVPAGQTRDLDGRTFILL